MRASSVPMRALALGAALLAASTGVLGACSGSGDEATPLKIGLLLYFGDSPKATPLARQRAFDLAVKHVNDSGGVFGLPVEVAVGDLEAPAGAVAEARRLIEDEGVHAIVGPSGSAASMPVSGEVLASLGVPAISPSATSPMLTTVPDGDFFFRVVLSDAVQGPLLAELTSDLGYSSVGVVYRDDAWGQGLSGSFLDAWSGDAVAVAIAPDQPSYLTELEESARGGPEALVLLVFDAEGAIVAREALDSGLYDRFILGDALKRPEVGTVLAGSYGVSSGHQPDTASAIAWEAATTAEHGEVPDLTYIRQTYDATIVLALAAQAAGSTDGAAIRDELRSVTDAPGETVIAGPAGVAGALSILAGGGEVDYYGASGPLGFDENGDLSRGAVGIWRFGPDGAIKELEIVDYP